MEYSLWVFSFVFFTQMIVKVCVISLPSDLQVRVLRSNLSDRVCPVEKRDTLTPVKTWHLTSATSYSIHTVSSEEKLTAGPGLPGGPGGPSSPWRNTQRNIQISNNISSSNKLFLFGSYCNRNRNYTRKKLNRERASIRCLWWMTWALHLCSFWPWWSLGASDSLNTLKNIRQDKKCMHAILFICEHMHRE